MSTGEKRCLTAYESDNSEYLRVACEKKKTLANLGIRFFGHVRFSFRKNHNAKKTGERLNRD